MMRQPKNYHVALKYAELLYSTRRDRLEDITNARKYFMLASLTKGMDNKPPVRALFGIIKATKVIEQLQSRSGSDPAAAQIISAAQEQLQEIYGAKGCAKSLATLNKMHLMRPIESATST